MRAPLGHVAGLVLPNLGLFVKGFHPIAPDGFTSLSKAGTAGP